MRLGDVSDRALYNSDNGLLYYDGNGSTSGGRRNIAILDNQVHLTAGDFLVV